MKRILLAAIVFMAVLTVLPALETHSIWLVSVVEPQDPAFQLSLGTLFTNEGGSPFAENAEYPTPGTDLRAQVQNLATGDIDVTLHFLLANSAKTRRSYTIEFKPTAFSVKKSGQDASVGYSTDSDKTYLQVKGTLQGVSVTQVSPFKAKLTFTGATCSANSILADFHLFYPKDSGIDPNADGYTMRMSLEIATVD